MVDKGHPDKGSGLDEDSWPNLEQARLLLVADGDGASTLARELEALDCEVRRAASLEDVEDAEDWSPNVAIIDSDFSGGPQAVIERVDRDASCVTILLVDRARPSTVATTTECGADTLVTRPVEVRDIMRVVEQELRHQRLYGHGGDNPVLLNRLVGESEAMNRLCETVALAAPSSAAILVTGESGTGKELVARAVHRLSPRRSRPFVAVNCGAIPVNLLESELFGHEKGAFTGATERRIGRFEQADTGTLFLDEVGELPGDMQVKLLRVLQEQVFERVGGSETLDVDVRVIAATNRNLVEAVERDEFRADLYYRLNVLQIETPPLRERKEDIQPLWTYMVDRAAAEEARTPPDTSSEVLGRLFQYHWPGNVRELENVARHAVTLSRGSTLEPEQLPAHFRRQLEGQTSDADNMSSLVGATMDEIERRAILSTYNAVGNVREAAELLEISERKIYYRLKQYREEGYLDEESDGVAADGLDETSDSKRADKAQTKPRLILAEDDEHVRWALQESLQDEYEVVSVANGRALVELIRDSEPDVIVSDVRMPGLDGIQVLRELHNESWDVPMVLITAFGDDATRSQADLLGAAAVLDKPLDMDKLRSELERLVRKSRTD